MFVHRHHSYLHTLEAICTYLFCHGKMNVEDICQTLLHIWVTRQFPVLIINGNYLPFSSTWVQPPPPSPPVFLVGSVLLIFLVFCVVLCFFIVLVSSRVLCAQCWQYIWIVHSWLTLLVSLIILMFSIGYFVYKRFCTYKILSNGQNMYLSSPDMILIVISLNYVFFRYGLGPLLKTRND